MPKRKWHGWRGMLNLTGYQSTASMVAEIEDTGVRTPKGWSPHDRPAYTLQFSNCDRSIAFELDFYAPTDKVAMEQDFENNLYKIDQMIEGLQAFRDGLKTEQDRYRRRWTKWKRDNPGKNW